MTESLVQCIHCNKMSSRDQKCKCGLLPEVRVSQQSHGKSTLYCHLCDMFVVPCSFDGQDGLCPYHQRQAVDEDGATYFQWDEFNAEGEEW